MFNVALFTVAKIWEQHQCPSAGERLEKMSHTHTHTHTHTHSGIYLTMKGDEVLLLNNNMDGP